MPTTASSGTSGSTGNPMRIPFPSKRLSGAVTAFYSSKGQTTIYTTQLRFIVFGRYDADMSYVPRRLSVVVTRSGRFALFAQCLSRVVHRRVWVRKHSTCQVQDAPRLCACRFRLCVLFRNRFLLMLVGPTKTLGKESCFRLRLSIVSSCFSGLRTLCGCSRHYRTCRPLARGRRGHRRSPLIFSLKDSPALVSPPRTLNLHLLPFLLSSARPTHVRNMAT